MQASSSTEPLTMMDEVPDNARVFKFDPDRSVSGLPAADAAEPEAPSGSFRLQYYLVVALIVITIIILLLLVLMLFSKYRWTDDKTTLNVDEFLESQDKRIASLNARIEEQLKRYDDA